LNPSVQKRLGYLVPEFPGQTHAFFWREIQELRRRGVEPVLLSTRPPPRRLMSHAWGAQAASQTTYLTPLRVRGAIDAARGLLRAGPRRLARTLGVWRRSEARNLRARLRLLGLTIVAARMAEIARKKQLNHVHAHSCADAANLCLFASQLADLPYSMTLHGPLKDYGPNQRMKWSHASFAIVITQRLRREAQAALDGAAPADLPVAPMGVDVSHWRRASAYAPWRGDEPLRIFSCGRLNPCKGHADLIHAVQLLGLRGVRATLEIAGEDEQGGEGYRKTLERIIAEMKLEDSVTLLGAVSEDRIREGLERAHVFALASLHEPLGVAIMEAMAMGAPVVATGEGGVKELIRDGEDGLLAQAREPESLARAIVRVAQSSDYAQQLASAAREKVSRDFHSGVSAEVLGSRVTGRERARPEKRRTEIETEGSGGRE